MTTFQQRVQDVLEMVRPALQMDGGDMELVEADEASGIVRISFQGACVGCPMSSMTLQMGIERALMSRLPEVKQVLADNQ